MTGAEPKRSRFSRPWQLLLCLLLYLAVCLTVAGCVLLYAVERDIQSKPERYRARLAKINALHAPAVAENPQDDALRKAWVQDLSTLAWQAHSEKFLDRRTRRDLTEELSRCLAEGMRLFPADPFYVAHHAQARVDMLFPGLPTRDTAEDIEAARQAYRAIEKLRPQDAPVRDWTWYLHKRAAFPKVPHEEALALLDELGGVLEREIARLTAREPASEDLRNFLQLRGEAAILSACRDSDPVRREHKLAEGFAYFRKAELQAPEKLKLYARLELADALDPREKALASPAFAATLLREQITLLRDELRQAPSAKRDHFPWNSAQRDLCFALEELIPFAVSANERSRLIGEAVNECAAAAETNREGSDRRIDEARKRLTVLTEQPQ